MQILSSSGQASALLPVCISQHRDIKAGPLLRTTSVGGGSVGVRTFGFAAPPPSAVHELNCAPHLNGVRCTMGPLSPKHSATFKLTFATDHGVDPKMESADKEIELVPLQEYARRAKFWTVSAGDLLPVFLVLFLVFAIDAFLVFTFRRKAN
jgi:hypothetical protein